VIFIRSGRIERFMVLMRQRFYDYEHGVSD